MLMYIKKDKSNFFRNILMFLATLHSPLKKSHLVLKGIKREPVIFSAFALWLVYVFYVLLIQSPQYESSAKLLLKSSETSEMPMPRKGLLSGSASIDKNANRLEEYIKSRKMLSVLNQKLQLKQHYQSPSIDIFSRIKRNLHHSDELSFYRNMLTAKFDARTDELNLSIRAFTPTYAKKLLETIIIEAKKFNQNINTYFYNNSDKSYNGILEIEKPDLPDDYSYPRPFYNLIILAIFLTIIVAIFKMALMLINEHRD